VTDAKVRRICKIDGMQFSFMAGKETESLRRTESEYGRD
jgi:hypothetical protein